MIQNGTSASFLARNPTNRLRRTPVAFLTEGASPDRFDHLRPLSGGRFAFEDLLHGGDKDFNDLVVHLIAFGPQTRSIRCHPFHGP
jgi:hypothetical protein